MSDILYRPELGYEKKYDSSKSFTNTGTDNGGDNTETVPSTTPLDIVNEDIKAIEDVLSGIPSDLADLIKKPLTGAKDILKDIDPEKYDPDYNPATDIIVMTPGISTPGTSVGTDEPNDDDEIPDVFSDDIPMIDVKVIRTDIAEKILKSYDNDLVSILADYVSNMKNKISNYYSSLSVIAKESGVTDVGALSKPYNTVTTTIKNINVHHMADQIIRSQIVRSQKMRLFKKLYSADQTISHIRSCKVSRDLRSRYYAASHIANDSFLDVSQNSLLEAVRNGYDRKHDENLLNLYKYLNSSVILMDECLSMAIQEAQAKAILIKSEGMKL